MSCVFSFFLHQSLSAFSHHARTSSHTQRKRETRVRLERERERGGFSNGGGEKKSKEKKNRTLALLFYFARLFDRERKDKAFPHQKRGAEESKTLRKTRESILVCGRFLFRGLCFVRNSFV